MNRSVLVREKSEILEADLARFDESQLINAISEGDEKAFTEIYRTYSKPLYNYLYSMIRDSEGANDILQEVFLAIWQGASRFKFKSTIKTWIYRIAYKQAISWFRRHRKTLLSTDLHDAPDERNKTEDEAISKLESNQVKHAITQLKPKHRAVLELAFVQELSYTEIAEIVGCPIGTVKSRMSYALRYLSDLLVEMDIIPTRDNVKGYEDEKS